jgi:methyl-accepting chemotaxis protein
MFNLNISGRIYLLVGLCLLALGAATAFSILSANATRSQLLGAELVSITDSATAIVAGQHVRSARGEISEEAAKAAALQALSDLRYRGTEYIFVNSTTGVMVMHPLRPEMVGVDQMSLEDPNGKRFVAEMVERSRTEGSGFVDYQWNRVKEQPPVDKLSYFTTFTPWGWIIGTGVYVDDLKAENYNSMLGQVGAGAIIAAILMVAAFLLSRTITKPISRLTSVMGKLAAGDHDTKVEGANRRDEIGDMAKAVEVFRENGLKVAEMTEAEAARIIRDQQARSEMMAELKKAFVQVVDAAVAGDFSQRVETEFPDAELNAIAVSINNLVATVDRGLGQTGEVLAALADTNLTMRMEGDYEGAFARLRDDTNAVGDKLSSIVGQLKETSRSLKTATGEILSGANDLSERTTKQAATIEETSAAMEQLSTTVLQNAERAREASEVASTVTRTAEEGGQVMGDANSAMERITQSSAKISNIIGLIDDIAFQTNLLALNASVEAARAGDAGKGFAVVAVEVRRLAQSAASASSEVKALIEQSGTEVRSGSKLVADAAARLAAMLEAARSSNALMDDIARDSREQASAIEEVNTAVRQLDEMTQHNAALVEETNAAIEQTDGQVNELDRIVDIFTIAGAPQAKAMPTAAPARGIKGLQERVKKAASSYLSHGNAAIDKDWAEF